MATVANEIRTILDETAERVWQQGGDLIHGESESIEALWVDVDAHLQSADLWQHLGDYQQINHHLEIVNRLLEKINIQMGD